MGLLGLLYYNTVDDKVENYQPLMYTRNIFYATQGIPLCKTEVIDGLSTGEGINVVVETL